MTAPRLRDARIGGTRAERLVTIHRGEAGLRPAVRTLLRALEGLLTLEDWAVALVRRELPGSAFLKLRRLLEAAVPVLAQRLARRGTLREAVDPEALARFRIANLVRELEGAQLETLRVQLGLLLDRGATPEMLVLIAKTAGLTSRQVDQVARAFDAALAAGATPVAANRTAMAVRDRLLEQRAQLIARTEAVRYTNATIEARAEELQAQGQRIVRQWISSRDGKVDGGKATGPCLLNDNGERYPVGAAFPSGHTAPPAHPGCRCILELFAETPT